MSEEIGKNERYISKLNYPNLLYMRINDIHIAINRNDYAKSETSNLLSTLLPAWIEEIKSKLEEFGDEKERQLEELEKIHYKMGTAVTFPNRQKRIYHQYSRSVLHETLGLMHKYSMLLIKEKEVMEYHES